MNKEQEKEFNKRRNEINRKLLNAVGDIMDSIDLLIFEIREYDKENFIKGLEEKMKKEMWGCAYCNCANYKEARRCMNCGKKKKVGSPFSLHI